MNLKNQFLREISDMEEAALAQQQPSNAYEKLLQKAEADIRSHIRVPFLAPPLLTTS